MVGYFLAAFQDFQELPIVVQACFKLEVFAWGTLSDAHVSPGFLV
jgi:hypothetical protein